MRLCSDSTCGLVRRPAGMARAYSIDLRERVVAAVEREGLSRHAAAARFAVAPSSAITWVQRHRSTGSVAPGQIGGHKPRAFTGAHRVWRLVTSMLVSTLRAVAPQLATQRVHVTVNQGYACD